jgi:hypothetical protein
MLYACWRRGKIATESLLPELAEPWISRRDLLQIAGVYIVVNVRARHVGFQGIEIPIEICRLNGNKLERQSANCNLISFTIDNDRRFFSLNTASKWNITRRNRRLFGLPKHRWQSKQVAALHRMI